MDRDFRRLLVPIDGNEPQPDNSDVRYRFEFGNFDVNERYNDLALIEVDADNPDIEWALQDPNVVEVGYSQPANERGGPPTDILDYGKNGPPLDEEEFIQPENIDHSWFRERSSVIPPENSEKYNVSLYIEEERDIEPPYNDVEDCICDHLSQNYDLSGLKKFKYGSMFEINNIMISRCTGYYLPNEKVMVAMDVEYTKRYNDTPARYDNPPNLQMLRLLDDEYGVNEVLYYAYDKIMEHSKDSQDSRLLNIEKATDISQDDNEDRSFWRILDIRGYSGLQ